MLLKVGDFVKCCGFLVCMLYYYDIIGLFMFLVCFDSGYWLYDKVDVVCLY